MKNPRQFTAIMASLRSTGKHFRRLATPGKTNQVIQRVDRINTARHNKHLRGTAEWLAARTRDIDRSAELGHYPRGVIKGSNPPGMDMRAVEQRSKQWVHDQDVISLNAIRQKQNVKLRNYQTSLKHQRVMGPTALVAGGVGAKVGVQQYRKRKSKGK
jgi:hypothetical protein